VKKVARGNNQSCSAGDPCASGLACLAFHQKCADGWLGSLCNIDGDCGTKKHRSSKCVKKAPPSNRQSCSAWDPCASGLGCLAGHQKCADGQLCSLCNIGEDCGSKKCMSSKCVKNVAHRNNQPCSAWHPCASGLACLAGHQKCADGKLGSLHVIDGDCENKTCTKGKCAAGAQNEQSCASWNPCASGPACLAGHQKCADGLGGSLCVVDGDCKEKTASK